MVARDSVQNLAMTHLYLKKKDDPKKEDDPTIKATPVIKTLSKMKKL